MKKFVIINKSGIKINADVNVYKLKSVKVVLFGMLLIVGVNFKKQLH